MAAEVVVDGAVLRVSFSGASLVWALRRRLEVPLAHVRGVRIGPRRALQRQRPALRLPGTWVPGVITAGTFRTWSGRDGKQLWDVRRGDDVLVVDLDHDPYARIVLEVADPQATAAAIDHAIAARRTPPGGPPG